MARAPRIPTWKFGLIGGFALAAATAHKILKAIPAILVGHLGELLEVLILPLTMFVVGFALGTVAGLLRGLSRWLGWVGDAILGVLLFNAFFLICMLLFDPDLFAKDRAVVAPLFYLATAFGVVVGPMFARDFRREQAAPPCPEEDSPDDEDDPHGPLR